MLLLRWDSQPAFSGMDYANFSSLKRHIGTATDCLFSTYSFWGSTVKEKESASFTHSVWVRGLHSVCPSICCPLSTCGSKLAMPAYALWRQPLSFPPYQVTLLSALSFLQACNTEMYQPVFQFWSLHLCVCVCMFVFRCLCMCAHWYVHTCMNMEARDQYWMSSSIAFHLYFYLFMFFETGFLTEPRAHQLYPTGYPTNSKDSLIYSAQVLELQMHAPHGVCHGCWGPELRPSSLCSRHFTD